jgi:hypothetical protein
MAFVNPFHYEFPNSNTGDLVGGIGYSIYLSLSPIQPLLM